MAEFNSSHFDNDGVLHLDLAGGEPTDVPHIDLTGGSCPTDTDIAETDFSDPIFAVSRYAGATSGESSEMPYDDLPWVRHNQVLERLKAELSARDQTILESGFHATRRLITEIRTEIRARRIS